MKKIKPGCFDCANAVCDECDPDQDARGELWVLLQLRVALGDPTGELMQDELVERARDAWADAQLYRMLRTVEKKE
ncbi:MAG: hypothetical protein ACK5YV_13185 [Betaproteobacteria bacterium]|jgi:hypothetical protein